MSDSLINDTLVKLVSVFNKLDINYVIVGGIAVIAFGRTRATTDIDVIIDQSTIDRLELVTEMQNSGFDLSLNNLLNLDEKMHVSFFHIDSMYRIDLKGIFAEKDRESIENAISVEMADITINIDHYENIIVNKLLFGSQIDMEDAMAVLTKKYASINMGNLISKALKFGVLDEFNKLHDDYRKLNDNDT